MLKRFDKRYLVLALLFMVKTLPQIFFLMTMPVILRLKGHPLELIGLVQLASVPYLLKFIWAPLLDRGGSKENHYKKWILGSGLIYGALIMAMGFLDIAHQLTAVVGMAVLISFVSSTQDIAINALYIKLLTYEERGLGSSSKVFALNLATILGSGFFLMLFNHAGWFASALSMGAVVLLTLPFLVFLEEPLSQGMEGGKRVKWTAFLSFFKLKGMLRWFGLLIMNSVSTAAIFFMIKPFLVDYGIDPDTIAFLVGFYGMSIAALVAMASSGKIFQRFLLQRRRAYIMCTVLHVAAVGLFIPVALRHDLIGLLYVAVAFLNITITVSSVVSAVLIMDFSRKGYEGLDYSLQMTGLHLGGMSMAGFSGVIVAFTGYAAFFSAQALVAAAMVLITVILFKGRWVCVDNLAPAKKAGVGVKQKSCS
jgi:MFS family permease